MATSIDVILQASIGKETSRFERTFSVDESRRVDALAIPPATTDMEVDFAPGLYTAMGLLIITASGPLTIKANSTSVPDWTMALAGTVGDALMLSGAAITALKGTTLTKLYVTNANQTVGRTLTCISGADITP